MSEKPQSQPTQPQSQPTQPQSQDISQEISKQIKVPVKRDSNNRYIIEVTKAQVLSVAKSLKEMGFDHVKVVTGIDYPDQKKIQIIYHIGSYLKKYRAYILAVKYWLKYEEKETDSLYPVYESAWVGERDTYEGLGVFFNGHPDMRRLFLPEDFDGVYPLRKDFKLKTEGIFVDRAE